MSNVILHIGTQKTGSTALQKFLYDNCELLQKHGVAFPIFTTQLRGRPIARNGIFLSRYCRAVADSKDPSTICNDIDENLFRLKRSFEDNPTTLITDENFSIWAGHLSEREDAHARYWQAVADILTQLGANSVHVVVYLRRQDEWASSLWRQDIKTGWAGGPARKWATYASRPIKMDYAGMLKAIEGAFGDACTILVRRYDRSSFAGGDIFHDFCGATGIPWDDGYQVPTDDANTSLTFDVAEALRHFEGVVMPYTAPRSALITRAYELSAEAPDPPGMTFLTPDETRTFMGQYHEGNRWIEEHFLGGEQLFSDEYAHPTWMPNKERIKAYRREFRRLIPFYPLPLLFQRAKNVIWKAFKRVRQRILRNAS